MQIRERHPSFRKRAILTIVVALALAIIFIFTNLIANKQNSDQIVDDDSSNATVTFTEEEFNNIIDRGREILRSEDGQSRILEYYKQLIDEEIQNKETFKAFQAIWMGYDDLVNSGLDKEAIDLLIGVDVSNFDPLQQDSIYEAIVTVSERTGDNELKAKYADLITKIKSEDKNIAQ